MGGFVAHVKIGRARAVGVSADAEPELSPQSKRRGGAETQRQSGKKKSR